MNDASARLLAVRAPLHAHLGADGERLALTTGEIPAGTEQEVVRLSVIDVATGVETPAPGAQPGDRMGVWSPDGGLLAFVTNRRGPAELAVAGGGDLVRVIDGTAGISGPPNWSADGRFLAVACATGAGVDHSRPYRWSTAVIEADGIGALDDPPQILVVEPATGATRWLTETSPRCGSPGWRYAMPRWSPDGHRLAVVASNDPDGVLPGQWVRVVDTSGRIECPPVPGGRTVIPAWCADGTLVVLVAEPVGLPAGSAGQLWIGSAGAWREVEVRDLLGDVYGDQPAELADSYEHCLMPAGGRRVVVRVGGRGRHAVAEVDVDSGGVTILAGGPRCVSPVGVSADRVVVTSQSAVSMVDLAVITRDGLAERPLTSFAPPPAVEVKRFAVDDVDAWLLAPVGVAGPLPAVVIVHGGPHYAYGESFSIDAHALCAAGYAVLTCNPRGSTGYGDLFAHAVHGNWPVAAQDVVAVVDHAVAAGWVDPTRLGIAGNSYGGYLSCWLACTTDRFAAAVAENPVTDLVSMYGTSDIGTTFLPRQFGGPPWEQMDRYLAQSPVSVAHRCRTPMLFVVGTADRRCPATQAWAMHRSVLAAGTPSEVLVLPGASHEGSTYGPPAARLAHDAALVDWMDRWLGR